MYYKIYEDGIIETGLEEWENSEAGAAIFDSEEWGKYLALQNEFSLTGKKEDIFFCRLEGHASYFFGTFHIPIKKKVKKHDTFAVYILENKLIFVDDGNMVEEGIKKIIERNRQKTYTIERLFGDFLMVLIEEDIHYLAELEREIAEMEEDVLEGKIQRFNYKMLDVKKEVSRFYCYYSQLMDASEVLGKNTKSKCRALTERVTRLQQEAQTLREYAMQVQDVYQSEISIHQNDIMKLLTIVTTIVLPLTLVTGWYGMNFEYMPELAWKYSYPVIAGISLLIVGICLWYFKKKKFF
ncbi:MAG: hypothetical protein J6A92_05290 [Lachnospiraceae bacterium]|nr:hypothetical protein [Lachnospiraceae bacterium]